MRVAAMDISLENMLKAVMVQDSQALWGGPAPDKAPPDDWWRWAYAKMVPQETTRSIATAGTMTGDQMRNMLGGYSLFRHVKTQVQLMATDNVAGVFAPVASIMIQDAYWQQRDVVHYPSFAEITASGGQWSFPPGQRSVGRGSFNHHTLRGTNDPQGDEWKVLLPVKGLAPPPSQVGWVFGTVFLAECQQALLANNRMTFQAPDADAPVTQPWAIARFKSQWQLGNQTYATNAMVTWPS